ncbi:MAG: nitroreductase family deazaflavin-dependent oxidoreductase [Acidimicrobiales bacterium]
MPMPMWVAEINKRLFNKIELKRGERPVLNHVGRSSGSAYRTPLEVHAVDGGFIVALMYGPEADWAKNVLAAGSASLDIGGDRFELVKPRVVTRSAALAKLPDTVKPPPDFLKVNQYFEMDVAD